MSVGFRARRARRERILARATTAAFNVILPLLAGIVTDRGH
jgi:hypothetical protein